MLGATQEDKVPEMAFSIVGIFRNYNDALENAHSIVEWLVIFLGDP